MKNVTLSEAMLRKVYLIKTALIKQECKKEKLSPVERLEALEIEFIEALEKIEKDNS